MIRTLLSLTLAVASANVLCPTASLAAHREPHGQVLGAYDEGSLKNSSSLDAHGEGFVHLFEKRNRHYGSQGLLELVSRSAAQIAETYSDGERLQIGDIAAKNGGPISGHESHQNGLDIDLIYYRVNHHEQTEADGDQGFVESFVKNGAVTANLDLERSWEIIKLFEASGRLGRIFMHTAIKKAFCEYARAHGEYASHSDALRRMQCLDNHFDHMHVRLTCPTTSPACERQNDPAPGTGCP